MQSVPLPVTLIAPMAPFRGGITRHSEALGRALAYRQDVAFAVESFSRLYPQWLYPGERDRDREKTAEIAPARHYAIDTLNPLTWRAVASRVASRGGIAVIPAWTFFVAPALGTIARHLRRKGVTVVMVVHNVADHESRGWKSCLSGWQLASADAFITHSSQLEEQLRRTGRRQPVAVVTHPVYDDFPEPEGILPRERALELLCFGLVRHYKGVDIAMRALSRSGLEDVRLTVAGEIWEGGDSLRQLAKSPELAGKVEFIDRYVPDQEAAEIFARADAVFAPYRSVTGSGVLAMAQHYRKPAIASNLPGLAEHIEHGRTGWLFPAGDEVALADLLRTGVSRERSGSMYAMIEHCAKDADWDNYADTIMSLAERTRTRPQSCE